MGRELLETVRKIETLISKAAALQKVYVEQVCPACPAPCCRRVHYLFTEKDVLFLRLSGRKHRWRRDAFKKKGCWFLCPTGCILQPESRPFICHHYICPDLEGEIIKDDPEIMTTLHEKFKVISTMRTQLWSAYLDEGGL